MKTERAVPADRRADGLVKRSILVAPRLKHIDDEGREKLLGIEGRITFDDFMSAIGSRDKDESRQTSIGYAGG